VVLVLVAVDDIHGGGVDKVKAAWAAAIEAVKALLFRAGLAWMVAKHAAVFFWQTPKAQAFEYAKSYRLHLSIELRATKRMERKPLVEALVDRAIH
jgi:hypothetical protein